MAYPTFNPRAVTVPLLAAWALASAPAWAAPPAAAPPVDEPTPNADANKREVADPAAAVVDAPTRPDPQANPPETAAPLTLTPAAPPAQDDAWTPWIGRPVRLRIAGPDGERVVEGRLVANAPNTLALALEPSGQVAAVDKSRVVGVDALPLFPPPTPHQDAQRKRRGVGLLIGGGVMTSTGIVISAAGIAGAARSGDNLAAIALVPGVGLLAGGVAMLVIGKKRHTQHRERYGWARVTPTLRVDRRRAQAGLAVQF